MRRVERIVKKKNIKKYKFFLSDGSVFSRFPLDISAKAFF